MADKKMITAVIDSIEERLPDNDRGWGKYKMYLEGMKGIQKVDVPSDVNAEYDLQEGFKLTLVEGPFKAWIVHSKSECFTGEAFDVEPQQSQEHARSERATPRREAGGGRAQPRRATAATAAQPTAAAQPTLATPKGGNTHTAWNQYQIDVRDPQMRMQTLLEISTKVNTFCVTENLDPVAFMDSIINDAKKLDEAVVSYLKL